MTSLGCGCSSNIGSINARFPLASGVDRRAAKAAINNLAKAVKELRPKNIRDITAEPGLVATDLRLGGGEVAAEPGSPADKSPDRFTRHDEVPHLVAVLAGDRCAHRVTMDGATVPTPYRSVTVGPTRLRASI